MGQHDVGAASPSSPEVEGEAHGRYLSGVALEGGYTAETFYNAAGGVRQGGTHLHNLALGAALDGELLTGVRGLAGYIGLLATFGGSVGELAGDAQGASNIEAPGAVRLYEAWVEKTWEHASLLLGLYDLNRDFYAGEAGSLFINSSQGIGAELASSGRNGPSIFPVTSLAARAQVALPGSTYGRLAILDGVPGHPEDETRFLHVDWEKQDGALLIAEAGLDQLESSARPFKVAAGVWRYTASFEDPLEPEVVHDGTFGAYLLGEIQLTRPGGAGSLVAFGRAGYADEQVHSLTSSWGGGLVYTGPLGRSVEDQLGLAVAGAGPGTRFGTLPPGEGALSHKEIAVELTYRTALGSFLHLQPDIQYILHPGMVSDVASCLLLGVRMDLTF